MEKTCLNPPILRGDTCEASGVYNRRIAELADERAAGRIGDRTFELEAARALLLRYEPPAVPVNPPVAEPSWRDERASVAAGLVVLGFILGALTHLLTAG
jgi:cytochrome c-type biogenesis protein CcmH/NrfG